MSEPICPQCQCEHTYRDGHLWVCPECAHEWNPEAKAESSLIVDSETQVKDAHGNVLQSGDSVVVIKDLKVKGAGSTLKSGTKVKNIRLITAVDGHNIACKIDGIGALNLKSEFVKKS